MSIATGPVSLPPQLRGNPASTRPIYIPTLDGWRAIAILMVLVSHYASALQVGYPFLRQWGGWGVSIFFGISGLLICTLLLNEQEHALHINLRSFYIRRSFRILPVAFVFIAVVSAVEVFAVLPTGSSDIVPAMLFVRNYFGPETGTAQHLWSLAVEEHFYLLMPPMLALLGPRRFAQSAVAIAVLVCAWRLISSGLLFGPLPNAFFRTDYRIDALFDGALAAVVYRKWSPALLRSRLRTWSLAAVAALLVLLSVPLHEPSLKRSLTCLAVPAILLACIAGPSSLISRLLELTALKWIGRISYSLYIWQGLFTGNGLRLLGGRSSWFANVASMVFVSILSFHLLEQPCIRVGRRIAGAKDQKRDREIAQSRA